MAGKGNDMEWKTSKHIQDGHRRVVILYLRGLMRVSYDKELPDRAVAWCLLPEIPKGLYETAEEAYARDAWKNIAGYIERHNTLNEVTEEEEFEQAMADILRFIKRKRVRQYDDTGND